jgi:hypothetical protein
VAAGMRIARCGARYLSAALMCLLAVRAMAADGFSVVSASVTPQPGAVSNVYLLNASLQFELPEGARQAVRDGVTLTLDLELELLRERNWWLDDSVATLEQHYQVSYHALSEQYLLRNLNSGDQTSFSTLDAALEAVKVVRDLPVLDQSLIDTQATYNLRLRAALDVRTLPTSLRLVLFWVDDWRQRTDWYQWILKP